MTHLKMTGLVGLLCVCTACTSTSMRVGMGDEESFLNEGVDEEAQVVAQDPILPEDPPEPSRLAEPLFFPEGPPLPSAAPEEPFVRFAEPEPPPVFTFDPVPEPEPPIDADLNESTLFPEDPPVAVLDEPEAPRFKELKDVSFDFDQARIRPDAVVFLESNAELIQTSFADRMVLVEGHCDERGSFEYNLVLGSRRAEAVKAYLTDLGVPETRIRVVSYGEERPVCKVSSEWCWKQNRRSHLVLQ